MGIVAVSLTQSVDQTGEIEGYVSEDGVDDMTGNEDSRDVYQRSITHCSETGQVDQREDDYCDDFNRLELVRTTTDFGNGDSGGPIYDEAVLDNTSYLYIIHIATQYPSDACANTYGSAAYEMNNQEDIVFNT